MSCARIRETVTLFYIGTEMGVWASWDRGAHWVSIRGDVPPRRSAISRFIRGDNDILLATHGRGLYILDDVSPLQNLTTARVAEGHVVRHPPRDSNGCNGTATATSPEEMDGRESAAKAR